MVIRNGSDKRKVYIFDLRQPQTMEQFYLQPRDIVYVPKKSLLKLMIG